MTVIVYALGALVLAGLVCRWEIRRDEAKAFYRWAFEEGGLAAVSEAAREMGVAFKRFADALIAAVAAGPDPG